MSSLISVNAQLMQGAPTGEASPEEMTLINAYLSKPLEASQVFVFPAVMATGQLTAYNFHLGQSSLRNFAKDAASGVPYHLGHDTEPAPYGYTYAGRFSPEESQALSSVYIVKGRYPAGKDGRSSNAEISDIVQGLRREVSVGFNGNLDYICDVCGKELFSDDCEHFPGLKLDGVLCTMTVENARLGELSGVDRGACPGAIIAKAQQLNAPKLLGLVQFRDWASQMSIPDWTKTTHTAPATAGKESNMKPAVLAAKLTEKGLNSLAVKIISVPEEDADKLVDALVSGLKDQATADLAAKAENPIVVMALENKIDSVDTFKSLLQEAAIGKRLGAKVRETAKTEAVRALGASESTSANMLIDTAPLEMVEQLSVTWKLTADKAAGITSTNGATRQTAPRAHSQVIALDEGAPSAEDAAARKNELLAMTPLGLAVQKKGAK